jgi:hypothetical protein
VKRRVWWTRAGREDFAPHEVGSGDEGNPHFGCNFIWTQWKKNKHLDYLRRISKDDN